MQTSVTFKNLDPSAPLKAYVSDKLDRFDRFLDNPAEASVVLSVEKHRHIAEINITGDRLNVYGKEETNEMYSAIDMVLDKIGKQIKKSKQKIREHRTGGKGLAMNIESITLPDTEPEEPEERQERVVTVESVDYKPMDVDEAVMQLDLLSDHFLVFANAKTDRINVLYRRKDGHYGLVQPNT
jgi:putative sigma-54 modulation protein